MNSLQTLLATLTQTPYLATALLATFALLALETLLVSRHDRARAKREPRETPR